MTQHTSPRSSLIRLLAVGFLVSISVGVQADSPPLPAVCPSDLDKASCVYYKEGHASAQDDRNANLSNDVQRHADMVDSRYERAFEAGYKSGWNGSPDKK